MGRFSDTKNGSIKEKQRKQLVIFVLIQVFFLVCSPVFFWIRVDSPSAEQLKK